MEPAHYVIRVQGQLVPEQWATWFSGLTIENLPDGLMQLSGPVRDQSELFAILVRIRDLGLTLMYLEGFPQLHLE